MSPTARTGAGGPGGREASKPVSMEADVQGLAGGDVAIQLPARGDSWVRSFAWALVPALTFVVLIFLWGVLVSVFRVPDYLVPAPQAVIPKPGCWAPRRRATPMRILNCLR